jgi:ribosomal protein S18 acetylase RimI-like enzyme
MRVRDAKEGDAEAVAALVAQLDFSVTPADAAHRIAMLADLGQPLLIADDGGPVGCLSWNVMPVLHRDSWVGRISMLVVDHAQRSHGIGAQLVAEAEARMIARGCRLIEVTSNEALRDAHRFYEGLGYTRTSYRFGKTVASDGEE